MLIDFFGNEVNDDIERALREDIGEGDHSSLASVSQNTLGKSVLLFKEDGVIAGISLAEAIIKKLDPKAVVIRHCYDGQWLAAGTVAAEIEGKAIALLGAERLLLNFMQRLSAIATQSKKATDIIKDLPCKILDTRKTTPLLRKYEKWAVSLGGSHNHRFGLYDMIMLKDNHIDSCGGITLALDKTVAYLERNNLKLGIEVETRNLKEVKEVLQHGGATRIMLDNFSVESCKEAVQLIDNKVETEASGGINFNNLREYALTGVNYISLGLLTHSIKGLDISMKTKMIDKQQFA